jgi:hypothetical protein
MIKIPEGIAIIRAPKTERQLLDKARIFLTREERTPGIHASDLLDPLRAYWKHTDPRPMEDRVVPIFMIGKVLHAFVLSAVDGTGLNWESDQGSRTSEILGIEYSPDHLINGIPREVKTSRSFFEPKDASDLDMYVEQLLIYMAAEKSVTGQLWVLYLNLKDKAGKTSPEFRAYTIRITPEELATVTRELRTTRDQLASAIETKNPAGLPFCRTWLCGEKSCEWWEKCQPEGRYGIKKKGDWIA